MDQAHNLERKIDEPEKEKTCYLSACPHWRTGNECYFSGPCVQIKEGTSKWIDPGKTEIIWNMEVVNTGEVRILVTVGRNGISMSGDGKGTMSATFRSV